MKNKVFYLQLLFIGAFSVLCNAAAAEDHISDAVHIECYLSCCKLRPQDAMTIVVEIKNVTKRDIAITPYILGEYIDEQETNIKLGGTDKDTLDKRYRLTPEKYALEEKAGQIKLHLRLQTATHSRTRGRFLIRILSSDLIVKMNESKFVKAAFRGEWLDEEVTGFQIELCSGGKVLAVTEIKELTVISQEEEKKEKNSALGKPGAELQNKGTDVP